MTNIIIKKGVTRDGSVVIPCEFDGIKPAIVDGKESEDLFITFNYGLLGLAKIIHEPEDKVEYVDNEFSSIEEFENGMAVVAMYCERFGTKFGLIDTEFVEQLECIYDSITPITDNLLDIQKGGWHGVYDKTLKKMIADVVYSSVSAVTERKGDKEVETLKLELQ